MAERYGYHGSLLSIDVGTGGAQTDRPDDIWWRTHVGGGLLATRLLLDRTPEGLDAFDPQSPLVITSSVMAGHRYVGLPRSTFAAKSPLTGGIGETRCDGPFAVALKGSGADALVLTGQSGKPVIVLVENGNVTFHDASAVWGMPVSATTDWIESQFGEDVHSAVIGPAGEQLVRFASVVTDRTFQAPRHGFGAVMGSKRIKAIVIRGDHRPDVADAATCAAITDAYRSRMPHNPLTAWQLDPPGMSAWVHTHGTDAALCTRNYRESVFDGAGVYTPDAFMRHYQYDAVCPGCPNNCFKVFAAGSPSEYDTRAGAMHQEITGALGPNIGVADVEFLFKANILCNELGMDPTSLGFTLSMAMEARETGLLSDEVAGGMSVEFGDPEGALLLIRAVASREGLGDILAEGSARAATKIGGAEKLAMHVKGLEMAVFEPRTQGNLALGYATAPIGPRFDICEHDWDYDISVGWPHALEGSRTLGILNRIPMQQISPEKVRRYMALNHVWSGCDALDLNIYAAAPTRALTLEEMAELWGAVTGWDVSSHELMRIGERRVQLMRHYNAREGIDGSADTLPDRFFDEPISEGSWKGQRIDRDEFGRMIRLYWRRMGWDERGVPTLETLAAHGLTA